MVNKNETLSLLAHALQQDGFIRFGEVIFIGESENGFRPWISIDIGEKLLSCTIGLCNDRLDRIVQKALSSVFPGFKNVKLPVPLFRARPDMISSDAPRLILATSEGYNIDEINDFIGWLRQVAYGFLSEHSDLNAVIRMAKKWNFGDSAQQYYIPAMMSIAGCIDQGQYTKVTRDMLAKQDVALAEKYDAYLRKLAALTKEL